MEKRLFPLAIFVIILFSSCLKEKVFPYGCDTVISYSVDIRPIIEATCKTGTGPGTGCHDAWIDDYSQVQSSLKSGDWQNAVLVELTMPKFPNLFGIDSLTADQIETMRCWIAQGYPEN